jgi:hypothetical protein
MRASMKAKDKLSKDVLLKIMANSKNMAIKKKVLIEKYQSTTRLLNNRAFLPFLS